MSTFEQLKKQWDVNRDAISAQGNYDETAMENIVRSRTRKEKNTVMKYFWASFTLQVLVYALLCHVIIKYGSDRQVLFYSIAGVLLFLPFTIMLMKKFKQMALNKPERKTADVGGGHSLHSYVLRQYTLLKSFYQFKKAYELVLIPLSSAIGTYLIFHLYVPGGVRENEFGAVLTFAITILSCVFAIRSENRKSFNEPLQQLTQILNEYKPPR